MSSSYEYDVLECSEYFLPLASDSTYEFKGEIGKLLIGVDECFEEDKGMVDVFFNTFRKNIAIDKNFLDLILPKFLDEKVAFLVVGWLE